MEDRPILRLDLELIGKIAAGEVVESPASAIKELVENSLDAGSTCVTVEIRDGGIAYLRVTDNGRGIRARDVRMAFERHATKPKLPNRMICLRFIRRGSAVRRWLRLPPYPS